MLAGAYERAIFGLRACGQPEVMREVVARRIIALAAKGERDPERLYAAALAGLCSREGVAALSPSSAVKALDHRGPARTRLAGAIPFDASVGAKAAGVRRHPEVPGRSASLEGRGASAASFEARLHSHIRDEADTLGKVLGRI